MGAVLQRVVPVPGGFPFVQWLHRDEALFADCEWSWVEHSDGAHVFPDYAAAEAEIARHTEAGNRPYPCVRASSREVAAKHEDARLERTMGGLEVENVQRPTSNVQRPTAERPKRARKGSGAAAWKRTLAEMERKHPHEEVYRETAKHLGERE